MTELVTWITANFDSLVETVLHIVGAASIIASLTPNESDNAIVNAVYGLINLFGFNVGKAINK